jgi:hypothetical protein
MLWAGAARAEVPVVAECWCSEQLGVRGADYAAYWKSDDSSMCRPPNAKTVILLCPLLQIPNADFNGCVDMASTQGTK